MTAPTRVRRRRMGVRPPRTGTNACMHAVVRATMLRASVGNKQTGGQADRHVDMRANSTAGAQKHRIRRRRSSILRTGEGKGAVMQGSSSSRGGERRRVA